jgi:hypothetical protein
MVKKFNITKKSLRNNPKSIVRFEEIIKSKNLKIKKIKKRN